MGGLFSLVGGKKSAHLAALSSSTGALLPWMSHPKYEILSFAATSTALYAGGGGGGGHLPKYNIANGRLIWTASPDGDVASVSVYHGLLLVGGHFNKLGAQVRHHAAAINLQTGKVDLSWSPDFNQILGVWPVLGYGQDAYVGGDFTKVGALVSAGLCALQGLGVRHHRTDALDATQRSHGGWHDHRPHRARHACAWKGRDNLSGICRYRVHQKINAGSVASVVPARPHEHDGGTLRSPPAPRSTTSRCSRSTARTTPLAISRARALGSSCTRTPTAASSTAASGTSCARQAHPVARITSTSKKNSSAALTFTGRQVAWVASKSSLRGKARVYIDGKAIKTVDLHSKTLLRRRVVFTRGWTADGTHSIRIVCLGTKGRPAVDIDALLVLR